MPVRQEISEGLVPVKVYTGEIEAAARQQLVNISRLPIVHHHVAAMPDVHLGIGATVGSVIPTKQAIIPAAVGRRYRLRDDGDAHFRSRRRSIDEASLQEGLQPDQRATCRSASASTTTAAIATPGRSSAD